MMKGYPVKSDGFPEFAAFFRAKSFFGEKRCLELGFKKEGDAFEFDRSKIRLPLKLSCTEGYRFLEPGSLKIGSGIKYG